MNKDELALAIEREEQQGKEYGFPDWMVTMSVLRLLTDEGASSQLRLLTNDGNRPAEVLSLLSRHRLSALLETAERFINHQLKEEKLISIAPSERDLTIDEQHVRYSDLISAATLYGVIDVIEEEVAGTRQIRVVPRV
jgi:hypothetical protein